LVEGVTIDELALGRTDSKAFSGIAEALRKGFNLRLLKALRGFKRNVDAQSEGFDGESNHGTGGGSLWNSRGGDS
jgi:hypothetical protein